MIKQLSKRFSSALCAALLIAFAVVPAFAESRSSNAYAVTDDASYFNAEEFEKLCTAAESAGTDAGFQIAVHTSNEGVDSSGMDAYYNNYHDSDSTYRPDGVMLVFDVKSGSRIILTYGAAKAYFDDSRMSEVKSYMKPYLDSGEYYQAANAFIEKTREFYLGGIPENGSYSNIKEASQPEQNKLVRSLSKFGWIGGIAGVVIAVIFVLVNIGRYRYNGKGGTYDLKANSSVNMLDSQDVFLRKRTTSVTIHSSSSDTGDSSSHGSSGSF